MGTPSAGNPLFKACVAEGQAMFLLAAADNAEFPDLDEQARLLVDAAIIAGVLGALAILKDEDPADAK